MTDDLLATLPPELLSRLVHQANYDAELTIHALTVVGLAPPPGQTRTLPHDFLLELGAAMRVLVWELEGLDLRSFDLPTPQQAIRRAFADAVRQPSKPTTPSLSQAVLRISIEQLAWAAPATFHSEIRLDSADEDALVEAMAQFLWDNRASFSAVTRGSTS